VTEPSRRVFGTESELALEYIDGNHLDETTVSDRATLAGLTQLLFTASRAFR